MSDEDFFTPFDDTEYAVAHRYLRGQKEFLHLMPPRKTLYVDWFLMRAIGKEVMARRKPDSILPMLVSDVVREFVPDTNPRTRELYEAYRNGVMKMFSRRRHLRASSRRASREKVPTADATGQQRLI